MPRSKFQKTSCPICIAPSGRSSVLKTKYDLGAHAGTIRHLEKKITVGSHGPLKEKLRQWEVLNKVDEARLHYFAYQDGKRKEYERATSLYGTSNADLPGPSRLVAEEGILRDEDEFGSAVKSPSSGPIATLPQINEVSMSNSGENGLEKQDDND
jgi:hypothetical protein